MTRRWLQEKQVLKGRIGSGYHFAVQQLTQGCCFLMVRLGIGYIDLLLMHAPGEKTVSTWQAMIQLKEEGVCR